MTILFMGGILSGQMRTPCGAYVFEFCEKRTLTEKENQ